MTGAILRGLYVLRKYGLPALAIMVVTFLSFGSMLRAQFAADDYLLIVANTSIQSLTSLPKLFTSSYIPGQGLYRPLSSATFAVNYAIGHLNPAGYHLTNVLLHALNGFLVYLLVQYYTGRKPIALLSSLVFIAHPVHTEAVSNIAGRPELLAAGAILVAWLLYVREEQHYYWLSLAAYFLGLLAKESAIVLVGILVLADVCEGRSAERLFTRVRLNRYGGYIAVSGLYLLIRILVLHRVGVPTGATVFKDASLQTRVLTMSVVFTRYLKLLIWPGELTALYDFSIVPLTSHLTVQAAVSIAGIIALLAFGILCIRQQPCGVRRPVRICHPEPRFQCDLPNRDPDGRACLVSAGPEFLRTFCSGSRHPFAAQTIVANSRCRYFLCYPGGCHDARLPPECGLVRSDRIRSLACSNSPE